MQRFLRALPVTLPLPALVAWIGMVPLTAAPASPQSVGDHQYTSEQIEAGARLYNSDCALCHQPNGDGVDGIDLRIGQFRSVQSDSDLRRIVREGSDDGQMPGSNLSDAEIDNLVAYIRAGFDPTGEAVKIGDPERGRALFTGKGKCSSCHRVHGVGPRAAPDLSDIGAIRSPASLQRSLLDPTAALLPIHRPVRIVTRSGETITGRRLNEDTYTVQIIDSRERLRSLVKAELAEYEVSTKSNKPPTTLSGDEVADVVGYLLTLRGLK